jgi:predicted peptidase
MNHSLVLFSLLCFPLCFGQEYAAKIFEYQKDTLPYRILMPKDYNPKKAYPLLLVLHGAGERGNDNESQLFHGGSLFQSAEFRSKYPAVVVFPQCPKDSYWANVLRDNRMNLDEKYAYSEIVPENPQLEIVEALIVFLEQQYRIDPSRRYVGGLSMGGMGTFELVSRNPDYFAAAFPICGGGNPKWASLLSKTPLWIFHGEKDDVVSVTYSKQMYEALKKIKAPVKLTLYPEVFHDSWKNAFADSNLMKWLFSNRKK